MASSGKKKTTMAKLTREARLRERRMDKAARKNARKLEASRPGDEFGEPHSAGDFGFDDEQTSDDSVEATDGEVSLSSSEAI